MIDYTKEVQISNSSGSSQVDEDSCCYDMSASEQTNNRRMHVD
jgi:hypothetical protein